MQNEKQPFYFRLPLVDSFFFCTKIQIKVFILTIDFNLNNCIAVVYLFLK